MKKPNHYHETNLPFRTCGRWLACCAVFAACAIAGTAHAGVVTKYTSGSDLGVVAAWGGGSGPLPATGDTATWSGSSLGGTLTDSTVQTWGAIDIEGASAALTVSGSALTLSGSQTVNSVPNSGVYINTGGQNLAIANNIALGASQTWTIGSGRTMSSSGAITGSGGLTLAGSGGLTLSGQNTFSGGATVNGGVLYANGGNSSSGAIGGGNLTVNTNGTVLVGGTDNGFVGYSTSAGKTITINAGGMVTNNGANTYHLNALVMNGGTLASVPASGDGASYGNWDIDHGVSTPGNSSTSTFAGGEAALTQSGGTVFNIGAGDALNVSTVLAHTPSASDYGLIKTGNGVLLLAGTNTYTSATTISGGTFTIGGAGQLGGGSYAGNITNNAALNYNSTAAQTLSGVISGTGTLTESGSGTLTLSGVNTYSGATTISGGTLAIGGAGQLGSGSYGGKITNNAALNYNSTAAQTLSGVISGTGTLTQQGAGTLTLSSQNTFSGVTTVNGGILALAAGNNSAGTLAANSSLVINKGGTVQVNIDNSLAGNGTALGTLPVTINAGGTLTGLSTADGGAGTSSHILGVLTLNGGTLTDGGTQNQGTFGTWDIYDGVVVNGGTNTSTIACLDVIPQQAGGTVFNVAAGGTSSGVDLLVSGTLIKGSGSDTGIIKTGSGVMLLAGTNTYTGTTTVSNGLLQVNGSIGSGVVSVCGGAAMAGVGTINGSTAIQSGGTLLVGANAATGTLSISNLLALNAGSTTRMRLSKTGGTPICDQLRGLTSVSFGGTLTVTNVTTDSTTLVAGDTFVLFNAAAYSGGFATYNLPALPAGLGWDRSQLGVSGAIRVIAGTGTPTFYPPGGGFIGAQSVTISSDAGSTIFYTTDGSNPTNSVTRISGASPITGIIIPVSTTETLIAYATNSGTAPSAVASATYATVPVGIWTNTAGGSWLVNSNWYLGAVPGGIGITADFSTLTLTANTTVTLNTPATVGGLIFADQGNAFNWMLADGGVGPLTLNAGTNQPVINVVNQNTTISATLAGTNGFTKTGNGNLTLTSLNTLTGVTTVNGGILALASGNHPTGPLAANSSLVINNGGTVQVNIDNSLAGFGTALGSLPVTINAGGTLTGLGTADGGAGTSSHIPGVLTLNGGTLTDGGSQNQGTFGTWDLDDGMVVVNGGTNTSTIACLDVVPSQTNGTVFNVAAGGTPSGIDLLVSGTLINGSSAGIIKTGNGVMALEGANTYTGATVVSNGLLQISESGSIGNSAVTVSGGTLEVDGTTGTGAVAVNGGTVDGIGTLAGSVTVNSGGTLSPATSVGIGTLAINGTLTVSGGTVAMRISKTGGYPSNDSFSGMTGVIYGGTLVVTNVTSDGTPLAAGDTFQLFSAGSYGVGFLTYNLPSLPSSLSWDVSGLATGGSIAVSANAPMPVFNPPAGNYIGALPVTITSESGAIIYYTTDGSDPASSGTVLSGPSPVTVTVPANMTNMMITAYAAQSGLGNSYESSATYSTLATLTWINPNSDNWSDTSGWTNGIVANGNGETADFSTLTLTADTTITLDIPATVGGLIFADQGDAFNWILADGGVGPLTLNAGTNQPVINVENQNTTISATLAATSGFAKTGSGTLTLSGANSYTGSTILNGGMLQINEGTTFASSNVTVNSGCTLNYNTTGGGGSAAPTVIESGNAVSHTGNGIVTITGSGYNEFGGGSAVTFNMNAGAEFDVQSGDIQFGWGQGAFATNYSSLNIDAGASYHNNDALFQFDALTGAGAVGNSWSSGVALMVGVNNTANNATYGVSNNTATFSGAIMDHESFRNITTGNVNLLKVGTGTQVLSGVNTYSGTTTISGGTLMIGGAGQLGGGSYGGNITDNAALNYNSTATQALSGVISGVGTLTQQGVGTLTLTRQNTFSGVTTVNGGILALASGNNSAGALSANGSLVINNGGTVQVNTDNSLAGYGTAVGSLPVTINAGGILTGLGTADGGAGTSSHFPGLLTLNGGTLTDGGTQNQGANGTWDIYDGVVVNGGTNTSTIACLDVVPCESGGTVFNVAAGGTASGVDLLVSGTLILGSSFADTGIIKTGNGVMALAGANTYIGTTVVSNGTLEVDGSIAQSFMITVAGANATLKLTQTGSQNNKAWLVVNAGGKVVLSNGVNQTFQGLSLGGQWIASGTWGSTASAAANKNDTYFSGSGVINVVPPVPAHKSAIVVSMYLQNYLNNPGGVANPAPGYMSYMPQPGGGLLPTDPNNVDTYVKQYFYGLPIGAMFFDSAAPVADNFSTLGSYMRSNSVGDTVNYFTTNTSPAMPLNFIMADYEDSEVNAEIANTVALVRASTNANVSGAFVGSYAVYPGGSDPALSFNNRISTDAFYRSSGLNMAQPNAYAYAAYGNNGPNAVAGAFWSDLELVSFVKLNLPAGHKLVPWVDADGFVSGYTAADGQALLAHLRMRGVDGFADLVGYAGDYKNISGWTDLDWLFEGTGASQIVNLTTSEANGFQWSGYAVGPNAAFMFSNLGNGAANVNLPSVSGVPGLPSSTPSFAAGTHTAWYFVNNPAAISTSQINLGDNEYDNFGLYVNGNFTLTNAIQVASQGNDNIQVTIGAYFTNSYSTVFAGPLTLNNSVTLQGYGQNLAFAGGISGSGGITNVGTVTLNGTNTYTGGTTVSSGTLLVNGSITNTTVLVAANATLGGSGGIGGATTVQDGGTIQAGNAAGAGTLTVATLNLGDGSSGAASFSRFEIATGGTISAATFAVNGMNTVQILDTNLVAGTYTLITYGGGSIGGSSGFAGLQLGTLPTGVMANLLDTGSAVQLAVTVGNSSASTNAYLTAIALSPVLAFTPSFNSNTLSGYVATEAYGSSFTVTVTNADMTAKNQLTYNGTPVGQVNSGVASGSLSLNANPGYTNLMSVLVTAQDGVHTKTYLVNVVQNPSQTRPQLTNSVSGGSLTLNWPLANLGYRLLMQTNNLKTGVSSNTNDWMTVPGSTTTNRASISLLKTNLAEYYRLVYP